MNKKFKILVVDDDEPMREFLISILEDDYEVAGADSTASALHVSESFYPDVLLTDIKMPEEDGLVLLEKHRNKYPSVPVILLTGHADKKLAISAVKGGAFDFIEKPFEPDILQISVQKAVEFRAISEQRRELSLKLQDNALALIKSHKEIRKLSHAMEKVSGKLKLGEMTGEIIHEINSPLSVIHNYAKKLKNYTNEDGDNNMQKVIEISNIMENCTQRMIKIIKGVKTLARNSSDDPWEKINAKEVVDDALSLLSEKIEFREIQFECNIEHVGIEFECRPILISQLIFNLLNNSLDAISELTEKWIRVDVNEHDDMIEIAVTDSGLGVSEDIKQKIFEVSFTTKARGKGTGIGLGVARKIAENHKGYLILDEECTNTRFVLSLPKFQSLPEEESQAS